MRGGVRRHRCVAPRKVLVVEIDRGQVIRLEVGDAGTRFGADDLLGLDGRDVARSDELYRDGRQILAGSSEVTASVTDADARAAPAPAGGELIRDAHGAATAGTYTSRSPRLRLHELELGGGDHLPCANQLGMFGEERFERVVRLECAVETPHRRSAMSRSSVDTTANRSSTTVTRSLSLNADGERLARDSGERETAAAGCGEDSEQRGHPESRLHRMVLGQIDHFVGDLALAHEVGARQRVAANGDAGIEFRERRTRQLFGVAHLEELRRRELFARGADRRRSSADLDVGDGEDAAAQREWSSRIAESEFRAAPASARHRRSRSGAGRGRRPIRHAARSVTDWLDPTGRRGRQLARSAIASAISASTSIGASAAAAPSPTVTSNWTRIVMVKMKPISNEAVPFACHGSGPSSVSARLIENSVWLPVRTASMPAISAMKWNVSGVMSTSRLRKP